MVRGLLKNLASCSLSVAGKWQHHQLRRLIIHEYQGPKLMNKYGVNVPKGIAVSSVEEAKKAINQVFHNENEVTEKSKLEATFDSAQTSEEMLRALKQMEVTGAFDESELGLYSLDIGLKLHKQGEDPSKVLPFAIRAFKELDSGKHYPPLAVATAFLLMGSVHLGLKMVHDSLGYLDRANAILRKFPNDDDDDVWQFYALQLHLAKCYIQVENYKEALPFCLKVLEMDLKEFGRNDVKVGYHRKFLEITYCGLEENVKALKQNFLAQRIFKNLNLKNECLRNEMDATKIMIALGRYDEAVVTLKNVVEKTDEDCETRVNALISMAKVLCKQDKFVECKRYLEIAVGILDNRALMSTMEVAKAYSKISMQYETMKEFEIAISLLKRTLALVEKLPQEQHSVGTASARIGLLLVMTGKAQQAIPYFESAAERMKNSFGPKHFILGNIYNNLGVAYSKLGRHLSAADMFSTAKDIMDVSHGPHHAITIEACQNLIKAYVKMRSYGFAIDVQQKVINAWESHGARAENELREARQLLEQLKKKAPVFYANVSLMKIEGFSLTTHTFKIPERPERSFITI